MGVDSHVVGVGSCVVGVDMYWQLGSGCWHVVALAVG